MSQDNMNTQAGSSDIDDLLTMDISGIDACTIDLSGSPYVFSSGSGGGTYAISGAAYNGAYTVANSSWNNINTNSQSSIQVQGDADIQGSLRVNGVDYTDLPAQIQAILDRLAILVPDPEKLEKYQALREAYEHYKTLEALCVDENKL